jgi:hypothetical protein
MNVGLNKHCGTASSSERVVLALYLVPESLPKTMEKSFHGFLSGMPKIQEIMIWL